MNGQNPNQRPRVARRRPSSAQNPNPSRPSSPMRSTQNAARSARPQMSATQTAYTSGKKRTATQRPRSAEMVPQKQEDARYQIVPYNKTSYWFFNTALGAWTGKQIVRYRKWSDEREAAWQADVVRVRSAPDFVMLLIIFLLFAAGTVAVFSASYPLAISKGLESNYYLRKQLQNLAIGAVIMVVAMFFPIKLYRSWGPWLAYIAACLALAYTAVFGISEGEAVRWVQIGPISFQPSELMKIAIVLVLAWYAEKCEAKMKDLHRGPASFWWNALLPCIVLGAACGLVLAGKHLSGAVIVGMIGFFLLLLAGTKFLWMGSIILVAGFPVIALYLEKHPYALKRITTFTDENANQLDELWQTTQSVYAIGSGGLAGVGLGQSRQKYSYLGNAHTDFIFSIWCEEFGFIGAIALVAAFLLFIWRGYLIALRAPDRFTMLTAFGITTHVGLQAFLNMFVASDIIMNTGVTLPFFSYGGSSTIILMLEMGILLSISRQSYKRKSDLEQEIFRRERGWE